MSQSSPVEQFVSADVSKDKLDVCVGARYQVTCFDNNQKGIQKLIDQLPSSEQCIVVCEPTGGYEKRFVEQLQDAGYRVILANAMKVRRYAESMGALAKNDKIDSQIIRQFAEDAYPKGKLEILAGSKPEFRKLRAWQARNQQLTKNLRVEKQRLEKSTDDEISELIKTGIQQIEQDLQHCRQRIRELSNENELDDKVERLMGVKGIGDISSHQIVTDLPELGSLSNKQVSSIVGVAPFCQESGKYKGKSRIRGGREALRSTLYMAVLSAKQHNPVIRDFYNRLAARGKPHQVAMVACIRKLLTILNAMFRNNTEWQDDYQTKKASQA